MFLGWPYIRYFFENLLSYREKPLSNPNIDSCSETRKDMNIYPHKYSITGHTCFWNHSLRLRCRLIIRRKVRLHYAYACCTFNMNLVTMYQQALGNCQYDDHLVMLQNQKYNLKGLDMKLTSGHWQFSRNRI